MGPAKYCSLNIDPIRTVGLNVSGPDSSHSSPPASLPADSQLLVFSQPQVGAGARPSAL